MVAYGLLRPSTIKHDFYSINCTFTGFYIRSHRLLFEFDSIRFIYDIDTFELTRGVDRLV